MTKKYSIKKVNNKWILDIGFIFECDAWKEAIECLISWTKNIK